MSVKLIKKNQKKTSYQKGGNIDTVNTISKGPSSNTLRTKFGDYGLKSSERKAISDANKREEDAAIKAAGSPEALKTQRENKIREAMAESKANRDKQDSVERAARTVTPIKLIKK